jgi:hypothetical protein
MKSLKPAIAIRSDARLLTFPVPRATMSETARMPIMDKFVAKANIEHFRKKLAHETNESERQTLMRLLAEEEAKLASIESQRDRKRV